jgi:transglutaminase-like putative cysteine protease
MRMSIRHLTRYRYEPEAVSAALRLRLWPPATAGQRPVEWAVSVNGQPVEPIMTDAHGDRVGLWHVHEPTGGIDIVAGGAVETADLAGVLKELPQRARPGLFLRPTPLTGTSDAILELASELSEGEALARCHALSAAVHEAVDYRPGVSDAATTAAEALALGAGVCQDQAHVFIAAARVLDIPARYVVGYLHDPDREEPAEETHAWAEAFVTGLGWIGFDVTNQICPTDLYVRLCCGMDAADAAPVRGTIRGTTEEEMEVQIAVHGTQGQSQSQQQS